MTWFNPYGFIFIIIIMIPNIIFAIKQKDGFANKWNNKPVEILEQIGRYGCFATMIFNVPFTSFGFPSDESFAVYLVSNTALIAIYCVIWIICFRRNNTFRALSLSIPPSAIFLLSGILSRSIILTVAAVIFAPCHIFISYMNAKK